MIATKEQIEADRKSYHRLSMIVGLGYIILSAFSLYLTYKTVKLEADGLEEIE
jgi:hypothetical protein